MKKNLFVDEITRRIEDKPILINSIFVVGEKKRLTTKQGDSYLHLTLLDKTGSIKAKIWDDSKIPFDSVPDDGVVSVSGRAETFNNTIQIIIETIQPVETRYINPSDFVPSSEKDPEKLLRELQKILKPAFSSVFKAILESFFNNKTFIEAFKRAPGAVKIHHAYIGGLLEHTLGVVKLCSLLCSLYPFLDRPTLLTGALFHDIGKIREYRYDWKLDYTDEGRLIGHSVLGVQIIDELVPPSSPLPSDTIMILKHMILSHHGEIETGAVQLPMTREAMALHLADNLDAKMASLNQIYEEFSQEERWTPYQNFYSRRFFLASPETEKAEEDGAIRLKPLIRGQKTLGELLQRIERPDE
ncbi:MAG: HD domain-containing protein [Syntrophobacterales bacterium]|nr:HD domain-containing protein [Syntrophobacterales bacterium]